LNTIITRAAEISYKPSQRLLTVRLLQDAHISVSETRENYQATRALVGDDRFLKLIIDNTGVSVDREARTLGAELAGQDGSIAVAMVARSRASHMIGSFYINFNKHRVPTRMFSSKEKADEWLAGFLYLTLDSGIRSPSESLSI
jgi:hypothetical protein